MAAPVSAKHSAVSSYENLLLRNLPLVQSVESGLRNVTWLLPGRFEDAELASEGLSALLSLVASYHDRLLSKYLDSSLQLPPHSFSSPARASSSSTLPLQPSEGHSTSTSTSVTRSAPLLPSPSDHTRYTQHYTLTSPLYRRASRLLATINHIELLLEMLTRKRKGDRARWKVVLMLEVIKFVLRMIILSVTRRPVLMHATPQREFDPTTLPTEVFDGSRPALGSSNTSSLPDGARPALSTITSSAPLRSHLFPLATALPQHLLPHPSTLLPELSVPSAWMSELLSSSATLLQVVLLIRSSRHQTSPYRTRSLPTLSRRLQPYLIPLLLRVFARRLRPRSSDSLLLTQHYGDLDRRLASSIFLTGPIWVGWTRPRIMRIVEGLRRFPLIGLAGELVEGYLPLVDDYFYYTSS